MFTFFTMLKINRYFSTSKTIKNHYEKLNLQRNCTAKEIKDSFITLSKKFHPDLNKSHNAHKTFLEINEAYKVLSNTESRRNYDLGLASPHNVHGTYTTVNYGTDPWKDPIFYHNRDKSKDYHQNGYYGIKGIEKRSNFTVLIFCICLATVAVSLQFLAIKKSFTLQRDDLIEKSIKAQNSLKQVRDIAATNGNKVQIEILKMRFADKDRSE